MKLTLASSLNKRFLIESDRGLRLFCPIPNFCLHLGIFVDLIKNYAEFFVRDLTICECPRDMVGYGVEFTPSKNHNLVMLFCLHREPVADKFTGGTEESTAQDCNLKPQYNRGCYDRGQEAHTSNAHPHTV